MVPRTHPPTAGRGPLTKLGTRRGASSGPYRTGPRDSGAGWPHREPAETGECFKAKLKAAVKAAKPWAGSVAIQLYSPAATRSPAHVVEVDRTAHFTRGTRGEGSNLGVNTDKERLSAPQPQFHYRFRAMTG